MVILPDYSKENKELKEGNQLILKSLENAYLQLLVNMANDWRCTSSGQALLCDLRNSISKATGNDNETVQNEFEAKALKYPK